MDGGNRDISVKQLHYHPSVSFISIQKCILRKRKLVSALGRNIYRSMTDIKRDLHYHLFYKFRNIFVSNHCLIHYILKLNIFHVIFTCTH